MNATEDPKYASERALVGAAISATDIALAVSEQIRPEDFGLGAHQIIAETVAELLGKGAPVTPNTVLEELEKTGRVNQVGGGPYLTVLYAQAAIPGQIGYYAKQVKDRAWNDRFDAFGARCQQLAGTASVSPEDKLERLNGWVDELSATTAQSTMVRAADLVFDVMDEIERGDTGDVIKTGLIDLDDKLSLRPGQLVVIGARPGVGKALALDTPLPTPTGWTTMKDVAVGDQLIGMDGNPTTVTFATEVMYGRRCYEVEFSDGTVIVADAEHLWFTETRASRRAATPPGGYEFNRSSPYSNDQRWKSEKPSVKTTDQIRATLRVGSDDRLNHSVPLTSPLNLPTADLPIDPYMLGYWLGDGCSWNAAVTVSSEDLPHFLHQVKAVGYHHGKPRADRKCWTVTISCRPVVPRAPYAERDSMHQRLRVLGLFRNKHIPPAYLRASESQRRALLAGLLDSDGTINANGRISFEVTSKRLAAQFFDLAASLGYKPEMNTKRVNGRSEQTSTCYRVGFVTSDKVFRLDRKNARIPAAAFPRSHRRFIVDVRPVASVPVRCLTVDNADHMYLASHAYVPTHNTLMGLEIARHVGINLREPVYFLSLEMGRRELVKRMISAEGRVNLHAILHHTDEKPLLSDYDLQRMVKASARIAESAITIDDPPSAGLAHVRARLRHMQRTSGVRVAVVDYLGIMSTSGRSENRQQAVAELTRGLKQLAREMNVVLITLAQLNRQVEGRSDRRPVPSDLKDSGAIEADADVVILLHREDAYDRESPRAGEIDLQVDKSRHGPQFTTTAAFQGHYCRIVDMAADPAASTPAAKGHLRPVS